MRYENLLSRSARIVWRHPWLCLLALLAGETAGGAGSGGGNSLSFPQRRRGGGAPAIPDLTWVPQWITDRSGLIAEVAAGLLVVGLVWFLVGCLASGALIGSIAELDGGARATFGRAVRLGGGSFWRVLGFRLFQALLLVLPATLLLVPPLAGAAVGGGALIKGLLLDAPLLVAFLFWEAFVVALSVLGIRSCVLDGTGPVASFVAAYRLLIAQFPRIALTAVVFGLVGIGTGTVLQLILGLALAPFAVTMGEIVARGDWNRLPGTILAALAVLVPLSLVLSSIVGAYYATAWTLAYRRFAVAGPLPEPPPLA